MTLALKTSAALALFVALGLCASHAAIAQEAGCTEEAVEAAMTVRQLRALRERCVRNGEVYANVLVKTNTLPLPLAPAIRLQPPAAVKDSEQMRAALGIYFYLHESYPTETDFNDLDQLIRTLGNAWRIDSVKITGSVDRLESGLTFARSLARDRAQSVRDYLQAAGLGEKVPVTVNIRQPEQGDSELERAQDRVAEVTVVAVRKRPDPTAAAAPEE
jgi:hypothetical protein